MAGQFALGRPEHRTDQVSQLAGPVAAIGHGGALSASPAPGIGTGGDPDQHRSAGPLQCPELGSGEQSDFYFDPHTKQYTGQQNVLQGWCAAIRWADKAMHSDFIHTVAGEPLYFETTDNFSDLRQRFFEVVQRCRQVMKWPQERVLSFVVDRAIFGKEVFEKVLSDPALHLITWEKGYQGQSWPPAGGVSGSMVIERARNRADDIRSYHLQYWDRPWPKDERLRQIVVQATNPKGRIIQVSILTDDRTRGQRDRAADVRPVGAGERFQVSGQAFWNQPDHQLWSRRLRGVARAGRGSASAQRRNQSAAGATPPTSGPAKPAVIAPGQGRARSRPAPDTHRRTRTGAGCRSDQERIGRLRQGQTRWQSSSPARQEQIEALSRELAELELKAETVQQTESRLERLIEEKMVRLDPEKKRLMDSLRVIARNVFYKALGPFKKAYNNYRDDHDQFRQLTQASGVLEVAADQIVVHLMPRVNYAPRVRRIITELLAELNAKEPLFPDGSGRRFKLRLTSRSELRLSIARSD